MSVIALPPNRPVACHSRMSIAPRIPKIAPDAPTVTLGRLQERARRARETGDEVEADEARPAEVLLDRCAEPPEREHVEPDVEEVRVEERRGDEAPPAAVGDLRTVEPEFCVETAAGTVEAAVLVRIR